MLPPPRQPYWFPPKRYGYGWGLPLTWQWWLVLIAWSLILVGVSLLLAGRNFPLFFLFIAFMAGALIAIAYAKGDPAGRHWGNHPSPEDETLCPKCGYDLRTQIAQLSTQDSALSTPPRCPECGTPFTRKTKIVAIEEDKTI